MTMTRYAAYHYRTKETVEVVRNGSRAAVDLPAPGRGGRTSSALLFTPALIDLQINGFAGVDFNDPDHTAVDDLERLLGHMHRLGVGYIFPTVITHSFAAIDRALALIARTAERGRPARCMPGIHLEGPYISAEDGPRGAHPKEHVRPPDWDEFLRWQETAGGRIKYVTLSPEYPGSTAFIEKLVDHEILVGIGHTAASAEQIRDAVSAGARISTHLGNGAHGTLPRHPNYIWEQLAADELSASLIVDGFHLPPSVVKTMVRAKGKERVILVSDAVSVAGLKPGRYRTAGFDAELTKEGVVRLAGTPYLAGSALTLPEAIANTARFANIGLADAFDMAARRPLELLAESAGMRALSKEDESFVLWSERDGRLEARLTVVDGEVVYAS